VRVTGWDRDEVRVRGSLGEGVERLSFEDGRDSVEVRVVVPRRGRRDPSVQLGESHLEVMVPRRASVEVETLAAAIEVGDVDGELRMESSAGGVTYSGGSRNIEASSAGGDISVQTSATDAEIDIEGVAGAVLVGLAGGNVSASTLTGSLRIIGGPVRTGDFESVSGEIYFEGEIAPGGELDFENFNGDIELLLPAETSASFDINTYAGSIETEFGYEGRSVEPYSPEQEAEFTLGGGGAVVTIESFSGVVQVRRR
jgi:DUF4097 and DUF4098 domain-containing protein YvlB